MKFMFIDKYRSKFRVEKMCKLLSVSRSGYYSWLNRPESNRTLKNRDILKLIKLVYEDSRSVYGSPRITSELHSRGFCCSENRVARLMRLNSIRAKSKRKFKVTTNSNHGLPVAKNHVKQNFTAQKPNRLWTSDITYIWTTEGWLYLAVVLDVFSRAIVGWATSSRATKELVTRAIKNAFIQRNVTSGLIFHSDRGSQFASLDVKELLKQKQITQSMSAKGNCYDNAITESFFSTLKTEHIFFQKYQTRHQAHSSIFDYIEIFYNRKRKHSAINYMAPFEFEKLNYLT